MTRNLLIGGLLVLVALLVWSMGKIPALPFAAPAETPGPPTPCQACAQATQAAVIQTQINLSALQAQANLSALQAQANLSALQAQASFNALQSQATAAVAGLGSHALATSVASGATQSAAETPAMLKANTLWNQVAARPPYPWEANALATANAAAMTPSAGQTDTSLQPAGLQLTHSAATQLATPPAPQEKLGQAISETAAFIAVTGLQAQTDPLPKPEPDTVLWMWLTPMIILVAAVLTLWGVTRWLARRRAGTPPAAAPR